MSNAIVTGANRGIGFEFTKQLVARGTHVVAACRKPSEALTSLAAESDGKVEVVTGIEVTSAEAHGRLHGLFAERPLDLLVLNAGILRPTRLDALNPEAIKAQFEVNAVAPLLMAGALHDRMPSGSKLALITSRMGSIADNDSGGSYGYRMSKAALNAAGKSLAIDLKEKGIAVGLLHPGWVQTEMTGKTGHVTPTESAAGLLERIDGLTLESSGGFVHMNGESLPW